VAAEALRRHGLDARSYSPTALENYAACPYRFFLQAIQRLTPREVPVAIDELSPLQRGSLVHTVQFELLGRLQKEGLLPVTSGNLDSARDGLDSVLDDVATRFREELAPAIERVWTAGVEDVRADLREWLRRMSEDDSGFVPWRFEFAFGLTFTREQDSESIREPVPLDCGIRLRGSIDLVEQQDGARIRVTDHKTGKARLDKDGVLGGGKALQPVLYALAAEKLFPDHVVTEGCLSYCTAAGGFEVRGVPLAEPARRSADKLAKAVGGAISDGFLPAYPETRACRFCDYYVVCGPSEELRTSRKAQTSAPLVALKQLRELP
jgi:ATP-dependent helicase/DNAse subunit B